MKRKSKALKSKASHSLVHGLMTLFPIAFICSQYGPEFLLLFVSVSCQFYLIKFGHDLVVLISKVLFLPAPLQQAELIRVSISVESSQLALRLSPFTPFDEGVNKSHRKWKLKKTI